MEEPATNQKFVMDHLKVEIGQYTIQEAAELFLQKLSLHGVNNFFQLTRFLQGLQPMPLMRHLMLTYLENFSWVKDIILVNRYLHGHAAVSVVLGKTTAPKLPLILSSVMG